MTGRELMTLLGVYVGNDPQKVLAFEAWLGRSVDFCSVYIGEASWDDFTGSVSYALARFADLPRPIIWSVPLIPKVASLTHAASGSYDQYYRNAAATIARARSDSPIYVRTGWEQNGSWMPWAAKGREAIFIGAFRQFATCFRDVSDRFRLVWCPNIGQNDPSLSYPGDDVVDVVGMDVYHFPQREPNRPDDAWRFMVTRAFGLQWHLEFASAHRKPMAYPEWGVSSEGFGPYIQKMSDWFRAGSVLYQAYWDSNADYPGELSNDQNTETGHAFRNAFGRPDAG